MDYSRQGSSYNYYISVQLTLIVMNQEQYSFSAGKYNVGAANNRLNSRCTFYREHHSHVSAVVAMPVVPVGVVVEVVAVAVEAEAAVTGSAESVVGIVIAVAVTAVEPAPELEALGLSALFESKE